MCKQTLFMFSVGLSRRLAVLLFTLLSASVELEACTFVYTNPDVIVASAESLFNISGNATEWQCTYLVKTAQPSVTITLELTALAGFSDRRTKTMLVNCSPRLDVYAVDRSGTEEHVARACNSNDVKLPKVFHISTSLAKIVFTWPSDDKRGEFKMNVVFSGTSDVSLRWLAAILGIALVGLSCGIVAYCVRARSNCRCCCQHQSQHTVLSRKSISTSDASHILPSKDKATTERERPHDNDSDDNLDVPIPQRQAEWRHHRLQQQQQPQLPSSKQQQQQQLLDNMRFPPPIVRSLDGEEREFWAYQKYLKYDGANVCESNYVELYKPPPNKTVADCESPPPCPTRTRALPPDPRLGSVV